MQPLFYNIGLNVYDNSFSLTEGKINIVPAGKPVRLIYNVYS